MLAVSARQNLRLNRVVARQQRKEDRSSIARVEYERSRIARELHAGAGQPLSGMKLNLELLSEWTESMPPQARETVARLRHLTEEALAQVRAVSHRLHPPDWQLMTIGEALRTLVRESGIEAHLRDAGVDIRPCPVEPGFAVKLALYRCAQECIANVIRHSRATRFELSLLSEDTRIELRVGDNGTGIHSPDGRTAGGLGLRAIREHVDSLGGSLRIATGDWGTTISIRLPLADE